MPCPIQASRTWFAQSISYLKWLCLKIILLPSISCFLYVYIPFCNSYNFLSTLIHSLGSILQQISRLSETHFASEPSEARAQYQKPYIFLCIFFPSLAFKTPPYSTLSVNSLMLHFSLSLVTLEMSNKAWDWSPEILQYTLVSQQMDYSWLLSYNLSKI